VINRAWAAAALLLLCTTLGGCGLGIVAHRGDVIERRSGSGVEAQILEAREQSAPDPKQPYWPFRLGQIYLDADSVSQAEAALKVSLARDQGYAPALSLLSKLYYDAGRHREAVEALESARAHPGSFPDGFPEDLLAGLALHYDALERPDLAATAVAAIQGPDRRSARSARVYVMLRGRSPDAATPLASAALDDDPRSAINQNNYGITRLRGGDPTAARRAFMKAIDLDPKLPGPYYNLAILEKYYACDDGAAARWLKNYREWSSDDPDSLFKAIGARDAVGIAGTGK